MELDALTLLEVYKAEVTRLTEQNLQLRAIIAKLQAEGPEVTAEVTDAEA